MKLVENYISKLRKIACMRTKIEQQPSITFTQYGVYAKWVTEAFEESINFTQQELNSSETRIDSLYKEWQNQKENERISKEKRIKKHLDDYKNYIKKLK